MAWACRLLVAWSLASLPTPALAQPQARPPRSSGAPSLAVVTFGPGDHTFSKFGHDALWVHDPARPPAERDLVFNYGTFRFDSPWLIVDFLQGRLSYWLSIGSLSRTVAAYRHANRTIAVQRLDLPEELVAQIAAFLHENAKPENRAYRYDYYRDNCATRIRDVLDRHLGGRLRGDPPGPAPLTYREHTRRLTIESPWLYFALDLAMGPVIDQPVTEWEAMFLPERVASKLPQLQGPEGRPLVQVESVLFQAERAPTLAVAPGFQWSYLLVGLGLAAALGFAGCSSSRWGRVGHAALLGTFGLVVGILGTMLLVLWLFTDHDVTYWNRNVLLCPIWALGLTGLVPGLARGRARSQHLMMWIVGLSAAGGLLALLLAALTIQSSGPALSLLLPAWLGATWGAWERAGRPAPARILSSAPEPPAA